MRPPLFAVSYVRGGEGAVTPLPKKAYQVCADDNVGI